MSFNYINCIYFLILFFVSKGFSSELVMTCPDVFTDGKISNINCTINHASIAAAGCIVNTSKVQFILTLGSTIETVCSIDRPPAACSSTLLPGQLSGSSCGCIKASGNEYTYQLSFPANESLHHGKKLRCKSCSPTTSVTEVISGSCDSITFKGTTEPPGTDNGATGNLKTEAIIGIVIGAIAAVALTIFIILAIYHFACGNKLCGKQGYTPCCKPAAHPVRHPK